MRVGQRFLVLRLCSQEQVTFSETLVGGGSGGWLAGFGLPQPGHDPQGFPRTHGLELVAQPPNSEGGWEMEGTLYIVSVNCLRCKALSDAC